MAFVQALNLNSARDRAGNPANRHAPILACVGRLVPPYTLGPRALTGNANDSASASLRPGDGNPRAFISFFDSS